LINALEQGRKKSKISIPPVTEMVSGDLYRFLMLQAKLAIDKINEPITLVKMQN